jgi:hypothetical protein
MTVRRCALAFAISIAILAPASSHAELTAQEIMQRVVDRDEGETQTADVEMTLIDAGGDARVRKFRAFKKVFGEDTHQILFVVAPEDIRNSGFLTYDYDAPSRDDDQWLYLPALQKSKRLAGGSKRDSFFGSDFSYADLASVPIDAYSFELASEDKVRGQPVWIIRATPTTEQERERTGYREVVHFVRKDNFVVVRALYVSERAGRAKYLDVTELEQIDGIWIPTEIVMITKEAKAETHRTILRNRNVRVNDPIDDDYFSIRYLERGL